MTERYDPNNIGQTEALVAILDFRLPDAVIPHPALPDYIKNQLVRDCYARSEGEAVKVMYAVEATTMEEAEIVSSRIGAWVLRLVGLGIGSPVRFRNFPETAFPGSNRPNLTLLPSLE